MSTDSKVPNLLILCLLLCFISAKATKAETHVSFDGFANLALTYSDDDILAFRSSVLNKGRSGFSFAPDSLLGLQLSIKWSDKWDAMGQIILQDRYDFNASNFVELAFLRYQASRNLSFKFGRFSANSFLFTDSRYVSHSQVWARAPVSIYSLAGTVSNVTGAQVNYITDTNLGLFKATAAIGENYFNNDRETKFEITYSELQAYSLELSRLDWRVQANFVTAIMSDVVFDGVEDLVSLPMFVPEFARPFAQELVNNVQAEGRRVTYTSLGAHYSFGDFELIAEYGLYDSDWAFASGASLGYVSLVRDFGNLSAFVLVSEIDRKRSPEVIDFQNARQILPDPLFQQLQFITDEPDQFIKSHSFDQRAISLGARWDLSVSWAMKFQFDHYIASSFGSGLFAIEDDELTPSGKSTLNVFNLSFSTTF